jgi:hypothetical protein
LFLMNSDVIKDELRMPVLGRTMSSLFEIDPELRYMRVTDP